MPPRPRDLQQHLRRRTLRRAAGEQRRLAAGGDRACAQGTPDGAAQHARAHHGGAGSRAAAHHPRQRAGAGLRPGDHRLGGLPLPAACGTHGVPAVRGAFAERLLLPGEPAQREGGIHLLLRQGGRMGASPLHLLRLPVCEGGGHDEGADPGSGLRGPGRPHGSGGHRDAGNRPSQAEPSAGERALEPAGQLPGHPHRLPPA